MSVPIDVIRQIRAIAKKESAFSGLAVRIVPNPAVDEGYTVRAEIPPAGKIVLQLDVYSDAPEPVSGAAVQPIPAVAARGDAL